MSAHDNFVCVNTQHLSAELHLSDLTIQAGVRENVFILRVQTPSFSVEPPNGEIVTLSSKKR